MKKIRSLLLAALVCGGVMSVSHAQADALADITARACSR